MPELSLTQQSQMNERRGTNAHALLWLTGANRTTGAPESIGFWTGDDHQVFSIDGEARTYFGAGAIISVEPIRAGTGLEVRYHRVVLLPMLEEVRQALRGYEPRQALVELHVCPFDIDSGAPLSDPVRMIRGTLNQAPEALGPQASESRTELVIASAARKLTFGLPLYRSGKALKERAPNDKFRDYSDVSGDWVVPWGED